MNMWAMVSRASTAEIEIRRSLLMCGLVEVKRESGRNVSTAWHSALAVDFENGEFSLGVYIPDSFTSDEKVNSGFTVVREAVEYAKAEWSYKYDSLLDDLEATLKINRNVMLGLEEDRAFYKRGFFACMVASILSIGAALLFM